MKFNNKKLKATPSKSSEKSDEIDAKQLLKTNKSFNKEKEHLKKTVMLLLVCILLLIAELPHAIFMFISIFNKYVHENIYILFGDMFDALVLVTFMINFLIYCFMSESFRKEFFAFLKRFTFF